MRPILIRRLVSCTLGFIVLGCVWFYLAPVALGGSTSYVVTHGVSMEPRFHTGDLALVRSQSSYHVGEVVAYNSHLIHTVVLHRIIARDGSRYVFKGDNNNFIDPEHPAANQLIGALWVHVPGIGATLQSIRSPALVGALIAIGVLLLTGVAFTQRRRRRRAQRRAGGNAHAASRSLQHTAGPTFAILAVGGLALLPFIMLALLAFTRTPTAHLPVTSAYTQSGALTYSADTSPGPVYPSGRATTGEPLFTRLISEVEFRYAYLFHAGAAHSLAGKAQLDATISAPSGWQRTLALGRPTYFHGDHALLTGTLDITSLSEMLRRVQTMTKVNGNQYTLTIAPNVSATGRLDAGPLHATFSPQSVFSFVENEIAPPSAAAGASARAKPATNPLASSASGSVTGSQEQTRFVSLGPARLSVATARAIAIGGIGIILCALGTALAVMRRRPPRDEATAISARYGHLIVPVGRVSQLPGVGVIDVADMAALVRIAEHYERSILHERTVEGDAFWVTDESGQFRFALGAPSPSAADEVLEAEPPREAFIAPDAPDTLVHQAFSEPRPPDTLVHQAYADELEWGGSVTAFAAQATPTTADGEAAVQESAVQEDRVVAAAADPPAQEDWAVRTPADPPAQEDWAVRTPADPPAQESADRPAASGPATVNPPPARTAYALITGREWTPGS